MTRRIRAVVAASALVVLAACDDGDGDAAPQDSPIVVSTAALDVPTSPPTSSAPSTAAPVTTARATDPPTTVPATTAPPTTAGTTEPAPTSTPATVAAAPASDGEEVVLGRSVEGRDISVVRRGRGDVAVLVVGVIHGDEDAGVAIVDELRTLAVPEGVELWLVPSMNPDGQAARVRHNANGVDLNRNFPENWGPIAAPGDWQYAGAGPASEPETQAMLRLTELVRPDLTLWYHQDLFRISPSSGREGEVRARYAELTGLPLVEVTGGTYTGTASTWSRSIADDRGVGFTVELGESLAPADARRHADAVLAVASTL